MKREPREVRDAQTIVTEQHVPRRISVKTKLTEQPVAFTTHEALDAYRVPSVENSTLNWVPISSAGALDLTHCDFSVWSARDEIRHIIEGSEPDVIIGPNKDQNSGCKEKNTHNMEFLCEPYKRRAVATSCMSSRQK